MNKKDLLLALLLAPSLLVLGELDILETKENKETNQRRSLRLKKFVFAERKSMAETYYNESEPAYDGKTELISDRMMLKQNTPIGRIPDPSSEFEVSFYLELSKSDSKSWKSILHFTDPSMSWGGWKTPHSPGYFYPGIFLSDKNKLMVNLISTTRNMHIMFSKESLSINKKYLIRILAIGDYVDLFVGEKNLGRVYMPLEVRPKPKSLDVVSKPDYPVTWGRYKDLWIGVNAKIESLKYTAYIWTNTSKSCEGEDVTYKKCRTKHRHGGDSTHQDCLDTAQAMNAKGVETFNEDHKHFCFFYFEPKDDGQDDCSAKNLFGLMMFNKKEDVKGNRPSGPITPHTSSVARSNGFCYYNPYFGF